MKPLPLTALLLSASIGLVGCTASSLPTNTTNSSETSVSATTEQTISYDGYDQLLNSYVDDEGWVDYVSLQQDRAALDEFNNALANIDPVAYEGWDEAEQIALWINAYNSLTLKSIIDQEPIKASIKDITGVWRIKTHPIVGDNKTLNNIEHDVLRVDFNEPRLHAAIVCASVSCPPLRPEPFTAENLDAQLEDQVQTFLSRPDGFKIDREAGEVFLSSIFDWFGEDWVPSYGVEDGFTGNENQKAVLNFISQYVSPENQDYLKAGDYKIRYFDYDWSLNDQR